MAGRCLAQARFVLRCLRQSPLATCNINQALVSHVLSPLLTAPVAQPLERMRFRIPVRGWELCCGWREQTRRPRSRLARSRSVVCAHTMSTDCTVAAPRSAIAGYFEGGCSRAACGMGMCPLSEAERQVLCVMLARELPGAPELRAQVGSAVASRRCDCGCPSVDLVVEGDVPVAAVTSRTPVNAEVDGVMGGGLIVFVDEGWLSGLEFYSVEDSTPQEFPPLDRICPYV